MAACYDFIIAGLGTVGSATCMTLARQGYRVLGIDRYHPPHTRGSHHGMSRSIRRAYLEGTSYVPMALRSWELWRALEQDSGQDLLVKTGNLTIGPPDSPAVSGFLASAQLYDIAYEYLTGIEIKKRWPQLSPPDSFIAGLEKEAGILFPERCIAAMLLEAEKAGAELVMNEQVEKWTEDHGTIVLHAAKNRYEAERLLISAGACSKKLLKLPKSPLNPKRVPVHWVEAPQSSQFHLGTFPVNFWQIPAGTDQSDTQVYKEFYSLPVVGKKKQVKVAFHNGLADCDPSRIVREVMADEVEAIKAVISEFLPPLSNRVMTSEVCMYTLTPDGHFYLGRIPGSKNSFVAALAGHGFKFAPVLGEMLADLMCDRTPAFDMSLFIPDRFVYKQV